MNTLSKITVWLSLLIISLFSTSCMVNELMGVKGNRQVIDEIRTIDQHFETINVQQGIQVYLTQGDYTAIRVEADENLIDLLVTEVEKNQLKLYFEKNVYTAKARNVYITTENVTGIHTSSGAALRTENTLQTDRLILSTSSGSSIKTHVNAKEVEMSSSSGSSAKLEGITNSLTLRASSGSNIDANRLQTIDTYAKASSGANIDLYVSGTLNAYASSGGNIRYEGKPNRVNKENSSGGKISGK